MNRFHIIPCASVVCVLLLIASAQATEIWDADDGTIIFSKAALADPTLAANQDQVTSNVAITRGGTQGLFNAVSEASYTNFVSPADTEWAFSGLNGNPNFIMGEGAANNGLLTFDDWKTALNSQAGSNILNTPGVLHLVTDDIYIDIEFTSWGQGGPGGGEFTYARAVPEPATLGLLALGAITSAGAIRRRRH
jgi:hypothetical protein